jgi:hypothetical protein
MLKPHRFAAFCAATAVAALTAGSMLATATAAAAAADQSSSPRNVNREQWAVCRKQADDHKLARGAARRNFMRNCMKNAQQSEPSPTANS